MRASLSCFVLRCLCALLAAVPGVVRAQDEETSPSPAGDDRLIVESRLLATEPDQSGFDVTVLDRAALQNSPALRLDDVLRQQVPGFSLFRRSSSLVTNPTTQGVSLRNIGPNGAGRTLVLLDGVPQNDPFGGWVYWSRLPPAGLERVEILQGGGAGSFGNAALGGTIALYSRQLPGNSLSVDGTGGSRDTYEVSAIGQADIGGKGNLIVFGRADRFGTEGFPVIRTGQRGAVDVAAFSEHTSLDGGARWTIREGNALTFKASGFQEDRGNGTPRTNNHSQAADFSLTLVGDLPGTGIDYRAEAYGQLRDYRQTFSSVDPARRTETPSQDQFSVPAQAVGGSLSAGTSITDTNRLLAGVDTRWVQGETNERFRFLSGSYTRERVAGGQQVFVGIFAEDAWKLTRTTNLTIAGRGDYYNNHDGSRREKSLPDGASTLDQDFASRDGFLANGRIGLSQEIPDLKTRLRAAAYSGFRLPALNEYYRPFRVRNDITEANGALSTERLYGAELGAEFTPVQAVRLSLGGFYNELDRPVANVTVAQGPANAAPFGFIPAGGVGRLRQNLGRAEIYGLETAAAWDAVSTLRLSLSYLYTHATVTAAPAQPGLEGKRLAQAPEHQWTGRVSWTPVASVRAEVQGRYTGNQFEDDLNTLRLEEYVTVDASVSWQFARQWRVRASVENLFNEEY